MANRGYYPGYPPPSIPKSPPPAYHEPPPPYRPPGPAYPYQQTNPYPPPPTYTPSTTGYPSQPPPPSTGYPPQPSRSSYPPTAPYNGGYTQQPAYPPSQSPYPPQPAYPYSQQSVYPPPQQSYPPQQQPVYPAPQQSYPPQQQPVYPAPPQQKPYAQQPVYPPQQSSAYSGYPGYQQQQQQPQTGYPSQSPYAAQQHSYNLQQSTYTPQPSIQPYAAQQPAYRPQLPVNAYPGQQSQQQQQVPQAQQQQSGRQQIPNSPQATMVIPPPSPSQQQFQFPGSPGLPSYQLTPSPAFPLRYSPQINRPPPYPYTGSPQPNPNQFQGAIPSPNQNPNNPMYVRQRYLQQYHQFQNMAQQFRNPLAPTPPSGVLVNATIPSATPAASSPVASANKALKEGWLQYSVMGMSTRKWFVLLADSNVLTGYPNEDKIPDTGERINLEHFQIDVAKPSDGSKIFGFTLTSVDDKSFRYLFATAECKDAVAWLVSIGQKTAYFSVAKEQDMVNALVVQFENYEKKPSSNEAPATVGRANSLRNFLVSKLDKRNEKKLIVDISQNPENKSLIVDHLVKIVSNPNGTLPLVNQFSATLKTQLKTGELSAFITEIQNFANGTAQQLTSQFPDLAAVHGVDDFCTTAVYEVLFPLLYSELFDVYKKRYKDEDEHHSQKVKGFLTISPGHLAINKKFWLQLTDINEAKDFTPPYQAAINLLRTLPTVHTPYKKAQCLINTAKQIDNCVKEHYKGSGKGEDLAVAADDLLPIFSYILIKANLPNMFSEVSIVNDFLTESDARSMEGYLLVTVQTCLSFIGCLESSELSHNASQLFEKISMEQSNSPHVSSATIQPPSPTINNALSTLPSPSSLPASFEGAPTSTPTLSVLPDAPAPPSFVFDMAPNNESSIPNPTDPQLSLGTQVAPSPDTPLSYPSLHNSTSTLQAPNANPLKTSTSSLPFSSPNSPTLVSSTTSPEPLPLSDHVQDKEFGNSPASTNPSFFDPYPPAPSTRFFSPNAELVQKLQDMSLKQSGTLIPPPLTPEPVSARDHSVEPVSSDLPHDSLISPQATSDAVPHANSDPSPNSLPMPASNEDHSYSVEETI